MADIRINALATTATTPASDDYLALDGAAQGTRKILATNIANNVTDVILGSSGPSVKSTLSARAPRQGLVFDGTAGATVTSVPAFGTADFTISAWINTSDTGTDTIFGANNTGSGKPQLRLNNLTIELLQTATSLVGSSTSTVPSGKTALVTYTRSGTSGTFYINGISAGTITDGTNWSAAIATIGVSYGTAERFNGSILTPLIYNRALSASEVVGLYESGAPAGADYNSASNTNISADTFVNGTGAATFSGASATAFTISGTTGGAAGTAGRAVYGTDLGASLRIGTKYRVTFSATITSGEAPIVAIGHSGTGYASNQVTVTNGTNTLELTIDTTRASNRLLFVSSPSTAINYSVSSLVWTRIGLLLAPDAAQAGGGLTWYDTSGNAANITLPSSGVSWNVPSSRVLGGNWQASGTLGVGPLSPLNQFDVSNSGTTNRLSLQVGTGDNGVHFISSGGTRYTIGSSIGLYVPGDYFAFNRYSGSSWSEMARFAPSGNFLLGAIIDGGQKLQVSGTGYFSAGITIGGTSDVGTGGVLWQDAGSPYSTHLSGANLKFETGSNFARTTALTLDSSQRTIAEKTVASKTGIFNGNKTVAVAALNTAYAITSTAVQGIVVIRDDTAGGSALWLIDPNQGASQISSNLTKTITLTFSGGVWNITQTAGSVTTNYSFVFVVPSPSAI